MIDTRKLPSENEAQYIWRICQAKDNGTLSLDWNGVGDIINNELYGDDIDSWKTSSAYRKRFQYAKELLNNHVFDTPVEDLDEKLREIEKAKIQLRDERNAWNKQNYVDARVSQKLDYLQEVLTSDERYTCKEPFKYHPSTVQFDNDILVLLSDLHIGQTFDSFWGEYNTDVAQRRMGELLLEVKRIQKRHNSENVYVSIAGDLVSGNIHKSIQVTNRENVIDQIKIASDLIADFLFELSKEFNNVTWVNVVGNHSRIDKKEDSLHDERLDDLIAWIVNGRLSNCENIQYVSNIFDNGIAEFGIRGKTYMSVHGDYDAYNKNGVSKLCMMMGHIPYAVLFGHLHTCAVDECNGVKMIRGGSLAGAGDSYTIEKRLSGEPSQMVCVCNSKGIEAYYTVELK